MAELSIQELNEISATHYSVAKFTYNLFKDEYKCHVFGRSHVWFQKETDNTWKKIEGIVIRNRLSKDVPDAISKIRKNFMMSAGYAKLETIVNNDANIKTLTERLSNWKEEKESLIALNKIIQARYFDTEIKKLQESIDLIQKKQEMSRSVVRDKKFAELVDIETKLYNATFKEGVMKELAGFFYVADP